MVSSLRVNAAASSSPRRGEHVYEVVRERLLTGHWRAGQSIPIEALKNELGVSKQPVMDAFRRLSAGGLVEVIPQVGCRVPVYPPDEAADFFRLFGASEAEVASIAATRRTNGQISQLVGINAQIGDAAAHTPDAGAADYMVLNRDFHAVIQQMTGSSIILRTSSQLWDVCDLLIMTSSEGNPLKEEVGERFKDHERIIDAIRNRDGDAARREMHAHITRNIPMLASAPRAGAN